MVVGGFDLVGWKWAMGGGCLWGDRYFMGLFCFVYF